LDELPLDFWTDPEMLPTDVPMLSEADEVAELAAMEGMAGTQNSHASEARQVLNLVMVIPRGGFRCRAHLIAARTRKGPCVRAGRRDSAPVYRV